MSFRLNRSGILSVTFGDGVTAYTRAIQVGQTYGGLLVGRPSSRLNLHHLRDLPVQVRRALGPWPVVVLPAEEERIAHQPAQNCAESDDEAWLPEFELWSWFEADVTKHPKMHGSCLSLVWHQAAPHLFIAPDVLRKMQAVRWLDVAKDFEF